MKTFIKLWVIGLASAAGVFAASPYVAGSVGYFIDEEEEYYSGRFGLELLKQGTVTHALEGEFLHADLQEAPGELRIQGLLANYKLTFDASEQVYFTAGAGAGSSRLRVSLPAFGIEVKDDAFTYQLMAALGYRFSPAFSVEAGVRYLNIGEADFGTGIEDDVGDDTAVELGLKFRF